MDRKDAQQGKNTHYAANMTFAGIAGLAGLITLLIVLISMFLGIWLDNLFDTNHGFTIGLILGSVPVTVIVMFYFVRSATARIKPSITKNPLEEEDYSGKTP